MFLIRTLLVMEISFPPSIRFIQAKFQTHTQTHIQYSQICILTFYLTQLPFKF